MKKILVDAAGAYIRTALTDGGKLVDIIADSKDSCSVAGNIYAGAVRTVLPNRFAFIDVGLSKNAFINLADKKEERYAESIKQGRDILVMVSKDPSGSKGAQATCEISLPGRLLVLIDDDRRTVGISKKITENRERTRLTDIINACLPPDRSVIVRTEAYGAEHDMLAGEVLHLNDIMDDLLRIGRYKKAPSLLYGEQSVAARHVLELYGSGVGQIITNTPEAFALVTRLPEIDPDRVLLHDENEYPLFDSYINREIHKALERKVRLKSGGFLAIDQTESCFVIDVNTGKHTGGVNGETAAIETNLEAAKETAYQIRLRNLSGMIVVDFIGVKNAADFSRVLSVLREETSRDRMPVTVYDTPVSGVVIMTRKRTRGPLSAVLQESCPCCAGTGRVNKETEVYDG